MNLPQTLAQRWCRKLWGTEHSVEDDSESCGTCSAIAAAVDEVLKIVTTPLHDMIALASELNDDDPWFGETHGAQQRIETALTVLNALK